MCIRDSFGATLGIPSLSAVPMKHCWLPIMSFISCVSSGIALPPLVLRLFLSTAIIAVRGSLRPETNKGLVSVLTLTLHKAEREGFEPVDFGFVVLVLSLHGVVQSAAQCDFDGPRLYNFHDLTPNVTQIGVTNGVSSRGYPCLLYTSPSP